MLYLNMTDMTVGLLNEYSIELFLQRDYNSAINNNYRSQALIIIDTQFTLSYTKPIVLNKRVL